MNGNAFDAAVAAAEQFHVIPTVNKQTRTVLAGAVINDKKDVTISRASSLLFHKIKTIVPGVICSRFNILRPAPVSKHGQAARAICARPIIHGEICISSGKTIDSDQFRLTRYHFLIIGKVNGIR